MKYIHILYLGQLQVYKELLRQIPSSLVSIVTLKETCETACLQRDLYCSTPPTARKAPLTLSPTLIIRKAVPEDCQWICLFLLPINVIHCKATAFFSHFRLLVAVHWFEWSLKITVLRER